VPQAPSSHLAFSQAGLFRPSNILNHKFGDSLWIISKMQIKYI
jgi:hypothetical protein